MDTNTIQFKGFTIEYIRGLGSGFYWIVNGSGYIQDPLFQNMQEIENYITNLIEQDDRNYESSWW